MILFIPSKATDITGIERFIYLESHPCFSVWCTCGDYRPLTLWNTFRDYGIKRFLCANCNSEIKFKVRKHDNL